MLVWRTAEFRGRGVIESGIESGRWSRVEISIDECRLLIVEVSDGDAARERRKTSTINNPSSSISNQSDEYYNSTFNHAPADVRISFALAMRCEF